jgi:hypothetical protein
VRLPEGNVRAFVVLRSADGDDIASGELWQKPAGGLIASRFVLNFKDGSRREESTSFSQRQVFRLERYQIVQRGPSFPTLEVSFDRRGRYDATAQSKIGDDEKHASGQMEIPADLYNGLPLMLAKNIPPGRVATVQTAVFTPEPRLVKTVISAEGDDQVSIAGQAKKATRYLVKLELGGVTGVIAPLIGKEPPDTRYWLVTGEVPAFAKFEGAMFPNGPVWHLEQAPIRWSK